MVEVRNLKIGEGRPKICVPITGRNETEIRKQARRIAVSIDEKTRKCVADLIEWRADQFEQVSDVQAVASVFGRLRAVFGEIPILFTIRTVPEGGEADMDEAQYVQINRYVISHQLADLVDVEFSKSDPAQKELLQAAREQGIRVIVSSHDFEKTPLESEMLETLRSMQAFGADIAKIAVMPQNETDVKRLLDVTWEASHSLRCPIITMSMGKPGCISRLSGQFFGSAVTFGAVGEGSAPGQVQAADLKKVLEILQ